jgi:hypothetical protein
MAIDKIEFFGKKYHGAALVILSLRIPQRSFSFVTNFGIPIQRKMHYSVESLDNLPYLPTK